MPCKCGSEYIVNKTHNMCENCNHKRIHGVSKLDTLIQKENNKVKVYINNERKPVRTHKKQVNHTNSDITKLKRTETLKKDRETYFKVFSTNFHHCEECGVNLPDTFEDENGNINAIWQYSHIFSKASQPEFRYDPRNFNRLCLKCHTRWEFGVQSMMRVFQNNQRIKQQLLDEKNSCKTI